MPLGNPLERLPEPPWAIDVPQFNWSPEYAPGIPWVLHRTAAVK